MITKDTTRPSSIQFHFDPLCPLAWRTALWIREVRDLGLVNVNWRLFSLEVVNRKENSAPDYVNGYGWVALRSLALTHRQSGNEAMEKLYVALGDAQHGRKENIRQREVVEACAKEVGLGEHFVAEAIADENTIQDVLGDHEEAVKRYHAFGVPTIAFDGSDVGFYGPIIHNVPQGKEVDELWHYTSWALRQPNLFELKRDRSSTEWGPVSA